MAGLLPLRDVVPNDAKLAQSSHRGIESPIGLLGNTFAGAVSVLDASMLIECTATFAANYGWHIMLGIRAMLIWRKLVDVDVI